MLTTSLNNWATEADGFGNIFAIAAAWPAFTIWMKEHLTR
jgi:hypothetical protein